MRGMFFYLFVMFALNLSGDAFSDDEPKEYPLVSVERFKKYTRPFTLRAHALCKFSEWTVFLAHWNQLLEGDRQSPEIQERASLMLLTLIERQKDSNLTSYDSAVIIGKLYDLGIRVPLSWFSSLETMHYYIYTHRARETNRAEYQSALVKAAKDGSVERTKYLIGLINNNDVGSYSEYLLMNNKELLKASFNSGSSDLENLILVDGTVSIELARVIKEAFAKSRVGKIKKLVRYFTSACLLKFK